jgi:16S rRNA (adenine1518-N6/adenine1519-N6)-dimethyltransferase
MVLRYIVNAAELTPQDIVVEIGPGLGILTRELARRVQQVVAVEVDSKLASILCKDLASLPNVGIIEADILQVDPATLVSSVVSSSFGYKVVADLPYYITSPILRHFLEASVKPQLMVVMVQKEVGEAIVASPGKMSLLAVSVQFYGKPIIIGRISSQSFYPPPQIDSVILRIELYEQPMVQVSSTAQFFKVVRAGFSAPRKQLRNALALGLGLPPSEAAALLDKAEVSPQRRAESLNLTEWARICEMVS